MHWTYTKPESGSDLEQGDFLAPTDELKEILQEAHPYFSAAKYIGFVVTTQTCDLVRRGDKSPKAHYINIAAIRSLKDTAPQIYNTIVQSVNDGIFRQSDKESINQFLRRLFNQNEQALGLFYFHDDADLEIGDPSVAFLRVTIALREEHYAELVNARRGGLNPAFQAKLGWLVGNLYSRAATPDWLEKKGQEELDALIQRFSNETIKGKGPVWLDDTLILEGERNGVEFDSSDIPALLEKLEEYRPKPPIEQLAQRISSEVDRVLAPNGHTDKLLSEAFKKTEIQLWKHCNQKIISKKIFVGVLESLKNEVTDILVTDKGAKVANRVKNNGHIKKLLKKL